VADTVPFDDREFGIVQRAALAGTKGTSDLIDGRRASCKQPFHVQLGRGLQELATGCADWLDVTLGNDFIRDDWSFDFDESALLKELSQFPQQNRALLEQGDRRGRFERVGA